ncbi:MAG: ABC transporter ATP-binding protein [Deltaproteobacteria bacterium]|nr:ABC transporter ATP-binding protein [Deltaproteobacteria bacterium]
MSDYIIETAGLTKRYRDKMAVSDLDLQIARGEVFGFLGPNGAGKTTTILMLLGLTEPTHGTASVCGFNPTTQPLEVKRRVGYLPENPGFYEDLTARENLAYIARLNRIGEDRLDGLLGRVLEQVGLAEDADRPVREFSRGMKQRLGIGEVLVKEPEVIILDEPTLGIDPEGVTRLLDLITRLQHESGLTVLLCSHLLHQVQQVCQRIGIIVRSRMVVQGSPDELGKAIRQERQWNFFVEVGGDQPMEEALSALPGVDECQHQGSGWSLRCTRDVRPELMTLVREQGVGLLQLRAEDPTLEEIYLKYFREA